MSGSSHFSYAFVVLDDLELRDAVGIGDAAVRVRDRHPCHFRAAAHATRSGQYHRSRWLILPQAAEGTSSNEPLVRDLRVFDLGHQFRTYRVNRRALGVIPRCGGKRASIRLQTPQLFLQALEFNFAETCPYPSPIHELAALISPEQKRAKTDARPERLRVAADHELVPRPAFQLDPQDLERRLA